MPSFHEVADYEMSHAGGFRQPNACLRENVADHQLNRYGPGTAAPMYEATPADFEWLEHMNSEPLEGKGTVCATTPNAQYMRPEHLEKLFDTFEETSWASSAIPTQEQAAQVVLGSVFGAVNTPESKMEDVLHWASNAQLGDGQLVNLKSEVEGWNPLDLHDENSNQSSSETAAPLTPSGSAEFLLKRTSQSGSIPSENGDDDSSTQSADDLIERRLASNTDRQQSENLKSSDLDTRAQVGKLRRAGYFFSRRVAQSVAPRIGGKSELKNAIQTINQINEKIFKICKHAPSFEVICKVYRYWLKKRWKNGGKPLLKRFDPVPPLRLRERPEVATESEQLAYLFCFNLEAVFRQQQERAVRVEQAEAQKKRRRRPCFNPAATKRRRRVQAAIDDAVSKPLTISFEPLDELFAHGWEVVEYQPKPVVPVKEQKKPKKEPTVKKQSKPAANAARLPTRSPKSVKAEKLESPAENAVFDDSVGRRSEAKSVKSPMGAAAAKAGALVKNFVSSVGCAFGYGNNGKNNHEMVSGSSGDPNAPSTPTTRRRSARVKSSDWTVARLP